jgi:DNA-binding transcriptional LysR family regulator
MLNEIDLSRVDLNLLVLFDAVLQARHVGRAADRLCLTPSAVSHGLGRLRRLLNDPLFLKTPKGVVPTERTKELAQPVADILARVRGVMASAEPFDPTRSVRRFTIGTADGFSIFLPPLLQEIGRNAPGIDIIVKHIQREAVLADLDAKRIDIGVAPFDEVPARFASHVVYEDSFVATVRVGHPFLKASTLENYCRAKHLLVAPRGDPRGDIDQILEQRGLSRRVAVAVPYFTMALELVGKTELISALPKRFVDMHAKHFGVAHAELPFSFGQRSTVLAVLPKVALMDAGVAWLMEVLGRAA